MTDWNSDEQRAFTERVAAAMGEPNFDALCQKLHGMSRQQVVDIASSVLGGVAASTGKKQAIGLMRSRHQGKLATRLGILSQGGRSAA